MNQANTLVSHLNRIGAAEGVEFANHGRIGTTSTRNIHMLFQALLETPPSDSVVFLVGANDANALDIDGAADLVPAHGQLEGRLRGRALDPAIEFLQQSATYKVANSIGSRLSALLRPAETDVPAPDASLVTAGGEVLRRNVALLQRLSEGLGFGLHIVLKPYLLSGIEVDAGIATEREAALFRSIQASSRATTAGFRARAREIAREVAGEVDSIVDLSAVFVDAGTGGQYFDVVHLGPDGNRIVAEAIYAKLSPTWNKHGG